ncbi:16615_t:CDS:1, partial [Gigaspora rosea]
MPFYTHQIFDIHALEQNEQIIDLSSFSDSLLPEVQITDSAVNNILPAPPTILPWTISPKMQQIIDNFENKIL